MPRRADPVVTYYLATPLFAVADLAFHAPVRLSTVVPVVPRVAYYAVVFALGMACRVRPAATPWVGMLESSANLLVLLLGILLPVWTLPEAFASGAPLAGGLTGFAAGNALLSGGALIASFHRHRRAAARVLGGR